MAHIEFSNVVKSFGEQTIIKGIDLQINSGEFLVLVGPSGCGKSTLLRSLAGLEKIDSGKILIDDKVVNDVEPQHRGISMVFQNYALYPHLNIFENISFALKMQKRQSSEIKEKVDAIAEFLQISHLLDRKPKELSGGQRQRVALGRALARQTSIILFDEPLSNLDAHLRNQMRVEIKKLHQQIKSTMIYVTHDQMEATTMGDRIAVLKDGKIVQLGSPDEIYHRPLNIFVAQFIGSPEMNFVTGDLLTRLPWKGLDPQKHILGVRPESLKVIKDALKPNEIEFGNITVEICENLGGKQMVYGKYQGQSLKFLADSQLHFKAGEVVRLRTELSKLQIFDQATQMNTQVTWSAL